jgi:multiple sugar transport system substrate-binding protein
MKKVLMSLLIIISAFVLAGCNPSSNSDKIEITIGMWPEPYLVDDVAMFEEWKRLFEEDYPEYEIIGQPYSYSLDTFFPMAQSGTQPTIFATWFTEPEKLIDNGFVRDITPQLDELGWSDKMDEQMREVLTFDEKIYGIPRDGYGLGLFINLEIFEEVGLIDDHDNDGYLDIHDPDGTPRYPTTMDELSEMAAYITETEMTYYEKDVAGLVLLSSDNTGGWQFSNIAWNFGAELQVQDNSGQWVSNLDSPEVIDALEWVKELKWTYDALPESTTLSYSDWFNFIGTGRAAMAFAGNDAISLPITNFNMDKDKIAFVPIPAGPDGDQYALFGGTPFMFSAQASDEQVMGALKFLEYMGQSPETSEIARQSMILGMQTAVSKNMPILPTISAWQNEEYTSLVEQLETQYVNVNMDHFNPFFDMVVDMRKPEVPYYSQEMYEILDTVIQQVFTNQNADPTSLLTSANEQFQTQYMNQLYMD